MTGTAPRRHHGPAGLLVVLFVVGGLVFSYGLGHAPPARVCTEHAMSVPVGAVSAFTGHELRDTRVSALHGLHSLADGSFTAPMKRSPQVPPDVRLCLAVLFSLILLGLAAGLRRALSRLAARAGWTLAAPPGAGIVPGAPPSLQVLRL